MDARYVHYPFLISAANEAAEFLANCKAEITTFIKTLLTGQEDNQRDTTQLVRSYKTKNKDQIAMKCASIIVYANGTLTECAVTSTIHALYFLGVCSSCVFCGSSDSKFHTILGVLSDWVTDFCGGRTIAGCCL